jgi:hypothetical protein
MECTLVPFISSRQKRKLQFLPVLSEAAQRIILSWISDLLNTNLNLNMGDELALLADRWTDFKLVGGRKKSGNPNAAIYGIKCACVLFLFTIILPGHDTTQR